MTTTQLATSSNPSWDFSGVIDPKSLMPKKQRLFLVFKEIELRPPVQAEMMTDMAHVIHTSVACYEDRSCVEMHLDNLISECWCKVTEMTNKGAFDTCKNRVEYFAMFKTGIMNHIYSHIQKYRFTEKRTGHAAPPKDKRKELYTAEDFASTKPNEVRIDDPDSGFQIADVDSGCDSRHFDELLEEVRLKLDPLEILVLDQMLSPNARALCFAQLDAERGRKSGAPLKVVIRTEHLVAGISSHITPAIFNQARKSIQVKCEYMKTRVEEDPKKLAAMATLIQFFGVQIPASVTDTTRVRLLMLAACNQFDKVCDNEGIKDALAVCDIPIPVKKGNRLACFGIMYAKNVRTCQGCELIDACALQIHNFGLDLVKLDPKLLNNQCPRVPVIPPTRHRSDSAFAESARCEDILDFLAETFLRVDSDGEMTYRHRDNLKMKRQPSILSLGTQINPFSLRFINPAPEIMASLEHRSTANAGRPAYYLPDNMDADEAINLIRAHAEITFKQGA